MKSDDLARSPLIPQFLDPNPVTVLQDSNGTDDIGPGTQETPTVTVDIFDGVAVPHLATLNPLSKCMGFEEIAPGRCLFRDSISSCLSICPFSQVKEEAQARHQRTELGEIGLECRGLDFPRAETPLKLYQPCIEELLGIPGKAQEGNSRG